MRDRGPEIVVVGSANLDLVVSVRHHPAPGETVLGGDLQRIPGGKGANQATAASRLGRRTAFVGAVGADDAGHALQQSLTSAGVDTSHLVVAPDVPTGTALIAVADDGDNTIVVSPGANRTVDRDLIATAQPLISATPVLLLQLEIPGEAVTAAAEAATGMVVCNPAPAPARPLPASLLEAVDVLVPNETELTALTRSDPTSSLDDLAAAAATLGMPAVVVTLGALGALLVTPDHQQRFPAPVIEPVDTTAAGDSFCAALADHLVEDPGDLPGAVEWAVRVGAATTLRRGAAPSLPTRDEVEHRLAGLRP